MKSKQGILLALAIMILIVFAAMLFTGDEKPSVEEGSKPHPVPPPPQLSTPSSQKENPGSNSSGPANLGHAALPKDKIYGGWNMHWPSLPESIRRIRTSDGALDASRQLTPAVIRAIGISDEEKADAELSIRDAFQEAESLMVKLIKPIEDNSDNEVDGFSITADAEGTEGVLSKLKSDLTERLGEERGELLLNSIAFEHYYAGFGMFDGKLWFENKVLDPDSYPPSPPIRFLRYELTDPETGATRAHGTKFFDAMSKHYGEVFKLSEEGVGY